jgi:hypothetical protein
VNILLRESQRDRLRNMNRDGGANSSILHAWDHVLTATPSGQQMNHIKVFKRKVKVKCTNFQFEENLPQDFSRL